MSRLRILWIGPAGTVAAFLFLLPLSIILAYSFLSRGAYGGVIAEATLENYTRLFDPLYGAILLRSIFVATYVTVACLLLGFPLALFIANSGRRRNLYLQLVMLPFWTSFLVRTYAWMFLLRDTGLINTALQSLGLISKPLPLLYNEGAVFVGLVYGHLPFVVLPIYASLERMDRSLVEAAADLGATPWMTTLRVILPLSSSGLFAGAILAFIPSLGAYLTSDLLGGGKTVLAGNLIQSQFTTARDWPFGSALSLVLMLCVLLLLIVWMRRREDSVL